MPARRNSFRHQPRAESRPRGGSFLESTEGSLLESADVSPVIVTGGKRRSAEISSASEVPYAAVATKHGVPVWNVRRSVVISAMLSGPSAAQLSTARMPT